MARVHKVLVIGLGSIGERHLRCFQSTGRAELALVEVNEALRQAVAERYGVPAYPDLDSALAHFSPEVAVIATPAPVHVPIALRLAEAGVHLLIEKPLSTSLEGIDRLRCVVRESRVTVAVGYIYRVYPALIAMKQAVQSGRFGRPVQLLAVSGQHFPTWRPAYRTIYYASRAAGGGAVQDALTHFINAGEWLLGPVERLVADAAHQVLEGVEVEDTVHLLTRHGTAQGCFSLNQHQAASENHLTVVCEGGTARSDFLSHRWRWATRPGEDWHDEEFGPLERDAIFLTQAERFLDAVEGKAEPVCSLEEGIQTLRVNLAVLASVEQGSWQTIPRPE